MITTFYYFYPRSPCGERRFSSCRPDEPSGISIHALLAESDDFCYLDNIEITISIHALLAESDALAPEEDPTQKNFYPRSPCGERRQVGQKRLRQKLAFLSTLSLRRATLYINRTAKTIIFLSTLSLRRATVTVLGIQHRVGISIHALLAESDPRELV